MNRGVRYLGHRGEEAPDLLHPSGRDREAAEAWALTPKIGGLVLALYHQPDVLRGDGKGYTVTLERHQWRDDCYRVTWQLPEAEDFENAVQVWDAIELAYAAFTAKVLCLHGAYLARRWDAVVQWERQHNQDVWERFAV